MTSVFERMHLHKNMDVTKMGKKYSICKIQSGTFLRENSDVKENANKL